MKRRQFMQLAAAAATVPSHLFGETVSYGLDLRNCVVVLSPSATAREARAAQVLIEEAEKRCSIRWPLCHSENEATKTKTTVTIYLATRHSAKDIKRFSMEKASESTDEEAFTVRIGGQAQERWISVLGGGERGLFFGVGSLLRTMEFGRQSAWLRKNVSKVSKPQYKLRGHQLGYRPKTNAYDGWSADMWDQYIRDLAVFGTNAIELLPPHTDDLDDSPHFPLPPEQMMVRMAQSADNYDLDVWIWYPAMARDYSDPATVENELKSWGHIFSALPRVDAVFVPGGDPGHTEPKYLLSFIEKQKKNLNHYHPKAKIWVSPQGFDSAWMQQFLDIASQEKTRQWLDGIVFGPMCRLNEDELRSKLGTLYPIRCYPDITHSEQCQYPVANWDIAFALTEGREVINPRPEAHANILRKILPGTVGFITYSEGCNDDVNKFVWSALGWDSERPVADVLRDFARYFIGPRQTEGFAQGVLALESNWQGPLMVNDGVSTTLANFQDLEQDATPAQLQNWKFQQALFRAYADAYVRARLLEETAAVSRARAILERMLTIGWNPVPWDIGGKRSTLPPNGRSPEPLLVEARNMLDEAMSHSTSNELRERIGELSAALFQSIHMQLAVELYQAEAVGRGASMDTIDCPVTDLPWLRKQIDEILKLSEPMAQISAVHALLFRTDPGPGGFYDELGNVSNRPHLLAGPGGWKDPDFRSSPQIGFAYPDRMSDTAPMAWKHWASALYDAPLTMHYADLDPQGQYRVRVVYSGSGRHSKIRLVANGVLEIHPLMERAWPPAPQEFAIPHEATGSGELTLAWTPEPGLGGSGTGCEVAEVWLMLTSREEKPAE
jgi:hypothetical protein